MHSDDRPIQSAAVDLFIYVGIMLRAKKPRLMGASILLEVTMLDVS